MDSIPPGQVQNSFGRLVYSILFSVKSYLLASVHVSNEEFEMISNNLTAQVRRDWKSYNWWTCWQWNDSSLNKRIKHIRNPQEENILLKMFNWRSWMNGIKETSSLIGMVIWPRPPLSLTCFILVETTPGVFYELTSDEDYAVRGRKRNVEDLQSGKMSKIKLQTVQKV